MDYLPPEILLKIFMNLSVNDVQSVSNTCTHWQNIVNYFNIWKKHWIYLLQLTNKLYLGDDILKLKEINSEELNLGCSCVRLKNIIYNKYNKIYHCLLKDNIAKYEYAILKTHYKEFILSVFKNKSYFNQKFCNFVRFNCTPPNCKSYVSFRSPPKLIENINHLFYFLNENEHFHVKVLLYVYPMGVDKYIESEVLPHLFEVQHVQEVILVPRVLVLCENLDVSNAVVVYSTSRSTEIAIVIRGRVIRWTECPVGGWQVAKSLHATFSWFDSDLEGKYIRRFDVYSVKSKCWLRTRPTDSSSLEDERILDEAEVKNVFGGKSYKMKSELYLATELMYTELDLCNVLYELLHDLPESLQEKCLSRVLLTGGNCQLKYLNLRVRLDLIQYWPKFAHSITTSVHNDKILSYLSATNIFEHHHIPITHRFNSGTTCRINRYHYIQNKTT